MSMAMPCFREEAGLDEDELQGPEVVVLAAEDNLVVDDGNDTSQSRGATRKTCGECASPDGRLWTCSSAAGRPAGGRRLLPSMPHIAIRRRLGAEDSPRRFRQEDGALATEEVEVDGRLMMSTGRGHFGRSMLEMNEDDGKNKVDEFMS